MPEILGIRIDSGNKTDKRAKISYFLKKPGVSKIFTPNPEMLVDSVKDEYFKEVLNLSDLNICDGKGLKMALGREVERTTGVDFIHDICEIAEREGKSVYLLGTGSRDTLRRAEDALATKYPNLRISGFHPGPKIDTLEVHGRKVIVPHEEDHNDAISEIVLASPDILLVAFGHSKQEKWIHENAHELPSVKIAMGVGGSFDFISGKVPRAPKFIRKIGFEWLYRLIKQPWRIKRIYKALVVFPYYAVVKRKKYAN